MADKGKIFICLEGGLVQGVASTDLPEMVVIIIDHDAEGMDDEEMEGYKSRVAHCGPSASPQRHQKGFETDLRSGQSGNQAGR